MTTLISSRDKNISKLARRLRDRQLYKCLDIGIRDTPDGNLYQRFRRILSERFKDWQERFLFDDATVAPYRLYDFNDESALNKLLIKIHGNQKEPCDIVGESGIVQVLRKAERVQRVYAPDRGQMNELHKIMQEVQQ